MSKASEFIEALHRVEAEGDVEPMARLFAPDAELGNPTMPRPLGGPEGAREFWSTYRGTFEEIRSEFRRIVESDEASTLEWTSCGTLAGGGEVADDGVSVYRASRRRDYAVSGVFRPEGARPGARAGGVAGREPLSYSSGRYSLRSSSSAEPSY